jgi:hypothetical protein
MTDKPPEPEHPSDRKPEHLSDRLKEIPEDLKKIQIEQLPPNQPSFLTVVLLFAAALIVIFLLAIFFLHLDAGKLFRRHPQQPTSQLILPFAPASSPGLSIQLG